MASFERGTKRQCLHCGTKFYDLNRDPIVCPNCGKHFALTAERASARREEIAAAVVPEEIEADPAAAVAGAEVISLEEAEEDADGDDIPEVEDVEVDDELGGDDDDVFLEEDDEDDDDLDFNVSPEDDEV